MKKLILLFAMLLAGVAQAQLNSQAQVIKSNYSSLYSDIRQSSVSKWGGDHEMVLYRINNQSEAYSELLSNYNDSHWEILNAAIIKWGTDKTHNSRIMKKTGWKFSDIRADWEMVKYNYDNQTEASTYY